PAKATPSHAAKQGPRPVTPAPSGKPAAGTAPRSSSAPPRPAPSGVAAPTRQSQPAASAAGAPASTPPPLRPAAATMPSAPAISRPAPAVVPKPPAPPAPPKDVVLTEGVTVKELSEKTEIKSKDLIKKLLDRGILATINQPLEIEVAKQLCREFGY